MRRLPGFIAGAAMLLVFHASPAETGKVDAAQSQSQSQSQPPSQRLHAMFDAAWERNLQDSPEAATYLGDERYGDRLSDMRPEAMAARDAYKRTLLQQARGLSRQGLGEVDRISLDLFIDDLQEDVEAQPFPGYRSMSLRTMGGFQSALAELIERMPVRTEAQVRVLLKRLDAYPQRVEQEIARLRAGLALGWVASKPTLQRLQSQLDGLLTEDPAQSALYEPFTKLGKDIPETQRLALAEAGRQKLQSTIYPALRRLQQFVREDYAAKAPPSGALGAYPGGDKVYAMLVRRNTTLDVTPAEVHQTGLQQVARLREQMDAVRREVGFEGDMTAFFKYLNTDPKFQYTSGEALLAGYRDIAKRIDPELPRLFAQLPRAPYGVRPMPAYLGAGAAEHYTPSTADASQPGWFNANVLALAARPTWSMETLVAHEAVPGHHLQISRALELGDLPTFRRYIGHTAYVEGWALYAETLGPELGLYKDPLSRFGHLQSQMFRATRLVIDTGIHALGWTREQAIGYMIEMTGYDPVDVSAEVDRYYGTPGQALGYMMGQLKITSLREQAKAELGERFDLRRFHMVIIDQGSQPLSLLERRVKDWIAAEKKKPEPQR